MIALILTVLLTATAPTLNTDDSVLDDLATIRLYLSDGTLLDSTPFNEPGGLIEMSWPVNQLVESKCFYMTAVDFDGNESDPSNTACTTLSDIDLDTIPDSTDNCTQVGNISQLDSNGDGYGNACDADLNNDGVVNGLDVGPFLAQFGTAGPDADFNGDGVVNGSDVGLLTYMFGKAPGPSGQVP
jgi:hypothetical protein